MNKEVFINQLLSMRAAIDAMLAMLCPPVEGDPAQAQDCQHPEKHREDISTMGHKRWLCKQCGHIEEVS